MANHPGRGKGQDGAAVARDGFLKGLVVLIGLLVGHMTRESRAKHRTARNRPVQRIYRHRWKGDKGLSCGVRSIAGWLREMHYVARRRTLGFTGRAQARKSVVVHFGDLVAQVAVLRDLCAVTDGTGLRVRRPVAPKPNLYEKIMFRTFVRVR